MSELHAKAEGGYLRIDVHLRQTCAWWCGQWNVLLGCAENVFFDDGVVSPQGGISIGV